ncbi:MAG: nicotinate phosphoribosyltransferase [Deltaproteobacteria bacterium]|nr:nicotinate phosphoribosyltransferase [Deltaproteobacteria bacterium]
MRIPSELYRPSLSLLTDFYQVTMASAYWKTGTADREAVFQLSFRQNPFAGGFSIACGLAYAADWIRSLRFAEDDLAYLASLTSQDGAPMFEPAFLATLRGMEFACDVDAVAEGTVVFPHEPLVRVRGPIVQAQLLETALLNFVNFQTLIATKAARVCLAAHGDPVLEFGMRRAQGLDGALAASRAAYVGGCAATSNVLAGKLFGIPVKGTHAHSFVMLFDDEVQAFKEYARAMPRNCVLLVDTYDTLQGVRHAVEVGRWLREQGHELSGVRLDSGDLAYLSKEARAILDAGGFPQAAIVASNDLDERLIQSLKDQAATISVWGVGTKLVTGWDQPALGGVYKLAAVRPPGGPWQHRLKLSEQAIKVSTPGVLQVRRYSDDAGFQADMIWDEAGGPLAAEPVMIDPIDPTRRKRLPAGMAAEDLLQPIFRGGRPVWEPPPLAAVRARVRDQLARCHGGIKRFDNPHRYPVGLEHGLYDLKTRLVLQARHAPD